MDTNNSKSLTFILYILYMFAIFSAGILAVIALIINYVKLDSVRGTIYESQFKWKIRTFWWYLIWNSLAFVPFFFLFMTLNNPDVFTGVALAATTFCVAVIFISWIWIVYRMIKGLIRLNDNASMY